MNKKMKYWAYNFSDATSYVFYFRHSSITNDLFRSFSLLSILMFKFTMCAISEFMLSNIAMILIST